MKCWLCKKECYVNHIYLSITSEVQNIAVYVCNDERCANEAIKRLRKRID